MSPIPAPLTADTDTVVILHGSIISPVDVSIYSVVLYTGIC